MTQKDLDRVKRAVIRKYPITAGIALHNVDIELSTEVDTAAVVGEKDENGVIQVKCMKVNPEFMDNLSFSERVFVIAHESLHIAFKHFKRSIDRPERDEERKYQEYCERETDPEKRKRMRAKLHRRYQNMWNIATDACINALLRKDGFTFPQGVIDKRTGQPMKFVDMEEGFHKCAEKIYDYLYQKQEEKDKQEQEQQSQNQQDKPKEPNQDKPKEQNQGEQEETEETKPSPGAAPGGTSAGQSLDDIDVDDYHGFDSHDSWTGEEDEKKDSKSNSQGEETEEIDEEEIMGQEQSAKKGPPSLKDSLEKARQADGLGKFVPFKPVLSWKRLLVGTLEKDEERWGTRRASRFNPNPRIEERITESRASAEVILDVSGSISIDLLRGFLLQLYPILEELSGDQEISIKVGCFADNFSGWQEIRSKKDIESFTPSVGGGTNFEIAATSFTKDPGRTITKIVFTDGCLGRPQKTRVPDIIWVVFGDKMDFVPLGGRIIKVSEKEYREMITQHLLHEEEIEQEDSKKI